MWAAKYVTSAVVGETIPEAVKGKTFYDLQAPLPGSKGTFDFVSTPAARGTIAVSHKLWAAVTSTNQ
jgi:hypothetical protein